MSFVEYCREESGAVWEAYRRHPWIEALAAGTLRPDQFAFFQLDDGPHIPDYNRVLALGISKAPVGHPWARAAARVLESQTTADELEIKRSLVEELGFPAVVDHDRWTCSPAREGYVNHLVRAGLEGGLTQIAASLYPCSLFTEVIGARFGSAPPPGPSAYRRWTQMYTRRARTEMCGAHAAVLEAAPGSEHESLLALYQRSLEHQVRVFDAAWELAGAWPGGRRARATVLTETSRRRA
jgi:thiaminase/transcriptional activator TenA